MAFTGTPAVRSAILLFSLISQCFAQFGMLDGMEGMMAPLMLGGMAGGGNMNLFGGGSRGAAGQSSGATPATPIVQWNLLGDTGNAAVDTAASSATSTLPDVNSAIHFIIGKEAKPDEGLIQYVAKHGWPPKDDTQLIGYVPHMQRIARAAFAPHLAKIALDTVKQRENARKNGGSITDQLKPAEKSNSVAAAVEEMKVLTQELNSLVFQKCMEWADLYLKPAPTTPATSSGFGFFPFFDGFMM